MIYIFEEKKLTEHFVFDSPSRVCVCIDHTKFDRNKFSFFFFILFEWIGNNIYQHDRLIRILHAHTLTHTHANET